jgi:LysM repeat protein
MANRKKSVTMFSLLVLTAIIISACTQPYSTVPIETPAADAEATSLFVSPFPTSDNPMAMVEELSTGTALAETAAALTAGTPLAVEEAGTEITPDNNASATPTLEVGVSPTITATLSNSTPSATQPAPTVIVNAPGTYTLQRGEFPYCIARRFNLDPAELLNLNGLASGDIYYPNLTLNIPQSGKPFPGTRALRSHPDTYTVADPSLSVYGVACVYGDVDPAAIVQANSGLSLGSVLTVGQQISIP